jgi:galactofuranosylgalactofuranosylrhamnosyl-N-acetylglucosaminyl-diphospho-decaprenol beta-1,5/1,6-galactofuranosyltransferase
MTADAAAPAQAAATPAALAEQTPPAPEGGQQELRVLQRVIFPGDDLDILPLYAETSLDRGAAELAADTLAASLGQKAAAKAAAGVTGVPTPVANAAVGKAQSSIRFGSALPAELAGEVDPRRSAVITAGHRVSFSTYFNAFPASYWRRWTTVESVTLRIRLAGDATVFLYRSSAKGHSHSVETIEVAASEPTTIERTLTLTPFIDGGWYWFDILAGQEGTTLIEADWLTLTESSAPGRASIGITTMNRAPFMINQLRTLGQATDVLDLLDKIYVVDQGTSRLTDHPEFADAAKGVGDRLEVIEQANLGGSGGFARSMAETVTAGQSDYLLLLDDDISLDPEGILRGLTFADLARRPTIVGGHMFSLYDKSVLHAFGETVAPYKWWWGPAANTKARHDFGRRNLRNTPWLHRRTDVDYNGWWMCLIPTAVLREAGLALPVFIKWDDAEYGLRARKHGFPTVSLPGMAAWHVPWQDKTDATDWQAYFHVRNRILSALLHSPYDRGGKLPSESFEIQALHLLSMQYSTAALRVLALEDILSGPQHLHRDLATKLDQIRELRAQYSDARGQPDVESFPPVRQRKPSAKGRQLSPPTNPVNLVTMAARAGLRQLHGAARPRPQSALSYQDANWWVLSSLDSALVSAADGTSAAWYKRDPKKFRELTLRSAMLHARLARNWSKLSAEYQKELPEFTSLETWRATFEASAGDPPR